MKHADFVIIGSGIIGLMTARELAKEGATVTIYDRAEPAHAASWAGGGILSPLDPVNYPEALKPLVEHSQQRYPTLVEELQAATQINSQYWPCGYLHLPTNVNDESSASEADKPVTSSMQSSVTPLVLPAKQAVAWYPEIAQVRNTKLLKALLDDIAQLGVSLCTHEPIVSLSAKQGRVTQLHTEVDAHAVNQVIMCAGAHSRSLLANLQHDGEFTVKAPSIAPVRGQMLLLKTPKDWLTTMVNIGQAYLIPRKGDSHDYVLIGSTLEAAGFDDNPNAAGQHHLLQLVEPYFPDIRRFPIMLQWAGLRPGSPDGIPTISQHPQFQNAWVHAGHHRNGILLAPASAQLCREMVLGQTLSMAAEPYQLV